MLEIYEKLKKSIEQRRLPKVIAIGGEERELVERLLQHIESSYLKDHEKGFNFDKLSCQKTSLGELVAVCNTLPMMASCRVVFAYDLQSTPSEKLDPLAEYLKSPSETTQLVIVFSELDKRQKWSKLFNEGQDLFILSQPTDSEMPQVVSGIFARHEIRISREVSNSLLERVGNNLQLLERAAEKLAVVAQGKEIRVEDVEQHIYGTREADAFGFGRAVAQCQQTQALKALFLMQKSQEAPIKVVGLLAWQLRQIAKASIYLDAGRTDKEIQEKLRLYQDSFRAVMRAAKSAPFVFHKQRLERLVELDERLKTTSLPPWVLLERYVMQNCPARR